MLYNRTTAEKYWWKPRNHLTPAKSKEIEGEEYEKMNQKLTYQDKMKRTSNIIFYTVRIE